MKIDLRRYFTPEAIVAALAQLPALRTPIMDLIFGDVRTVPRPVVGTKDLGLPTGNIPVDRPLAPLQGHVSHVPLKTSRAESHDTAGWFRVAFSRFTTICSFSAHQCS